MSGSTERIVSAPKLELVLLWHMHQPDYRDTVTGEVLEPWTYLHALKDYVDMAGHLERHPDVRAVVNFTPVLIDQLEALGAELEQGVSRERLARLLRTPDLGSVALADKQWLLEHGFRCNHPTMLAPFQGYAELWRIRQSFEDDIAGAARYLGEAYFADLITWYHLAWTGETTRRSVPLVRELIKKGAGFTLAEREALYALNCEVIKQIVPRYRRLAERGQIELSSTPYTHPLAPLLLDFESVREALSAAAIPASGAYPGGQARVDWQIAQAQARHGEVFGAPARGMWPAEGALSDEFLARLARSDVQWVMTGEAVLTNSLKVQGEPIDDRERHLASAYRFDSGRATGVFFRDDELSDLIGFEYARWHGKAAANDLIARLERRRDRLAGAVSDPLVVIALDGENAWEHFPYNGYYFFEELYGYLSAHEGITTTTPSRYLDRCGSRVPTLPHIVAGSWVYGNLSTWMGDPVKNSAWDRLCRAKQAHDARAREANWTEAQRAAIAMQLARAESSDWFWWLGEGAEGHGPRTFDYLARRNLANLYRLIGVEQPPELDRPAVGEGEGREGAPTVGAMRRSS